MASNVQFQQTSTVRNVPLQNMNNPLPNLMGNNPMGNNPMGNMPMGNNPMGNIPMGNNPMGNNPLANAQLPGQKQAQDFVHRIGEAVTGGDTHTGYLAEYIKTLQKNPFRHRMLVSGSSTALQELLASWLAKDRSRNGHYFTSRIPKMALYGAFISAPMGHFMIRVMQWFFAKRTSLKAKVFQILISNLIISPIQNSVYLVAMAVIHGARTLHQIRATVRAGFWRAMQVSWISAPLSLMFAQQFLPESMWVSWFNFVAFVTGVYINTHTKKKRLAALRQMSSRRDDEYRRDY